jgi:hypothetical protein
MSSEIKKNKISRKIPEKMRCLQRRRLQAHP